MSSTDLSGFADLPPEIRLRIWRTMIDGDLSPPRAIIGDTLWEPRTIGALAVNHESCAEALRHRPDLETFKYTLANAPWHTGAGRREKVWLSTEADVFVIDPIRKFTLGKWEIPTLKYAIRTIAIPQSKFGTSNHSLHCAQHLSQLNDARNFKRLKTLVILRDDPAQEVIPHLVILDPAIRSASDDIRVSIDPTPLSQVEMDAFGYDIQWYNSFIFIIRQQKGSNWELPEIKWGCLVRN
ncbi:uncharacterized protein Bfra_009482 [Botrytis fragariae]|uniref:2EXR domain-containing protein n=1 Tax=Botrytis fragariae TaxID=1964551 RepID=A0A8H6AP55_9HELO|nr:uncharacterized protein Bfra_009482 [Botrytis fragariae]KAF5870928.1 hypothetical protein Bfra_009482 [Botrytis fragariae]